MKQIAVANLFDLNGSLMASLFTGVVYPFEVLPHIGEYILKLGPKLDKEKYTEVCNSVWIANSAVIADSAQIAGPCIIGENCEVRQGAFLRGNTLIGEACVIGNSTEIKNSVLISHVQVPHFNYVGDSVLGSFSHLGASAITSNVKSDKSEVTVLLNGSKLSTGLKKFGAILGDGVEIGCSAVLNPGTIVGKNTTVYPLSSVRGFVEENCIFKNSTEVIKKYDKRKMGYS